MTTPDDIGILRQEVETARDQIAARHGRRHVLVHVLSMSLLRGDERSLKAAWNTYHTRTITG